MLCGYLNFDRTINYYFKIIQNQRIIGFDSLKKIKIRNHGDLGYFENLKN